MVPGLAGLQVFEEGEGTHVTVRGFAAGAVQLGDVEWQACNWLRVPGFSNLHGVLANPRL